MNSNALPAQFHDLEPFLGWALPSERERVLRRLAVPVEEVKVFYDALWQRMDDIIGYLNQFPYDAIPEDGRRLRDMALSLVEVSGLVEMYKNMANLSMVEASRFLAEE